MSSQSTYKIEFDNLKVKIINKNFVELYYPEEVDVNMETVLKLDQIIFEKTEGNKFYLFCSFENSYGSMVSDAQKFLAREARTVKQIKANAIVINNLPIRLLVKFYIRFYRPIYATKIFSNAKSARMWLTEKYAHEHYNNSSDLAKAQ
ncbi:DUF7793 family protein [Crocinitomix algicola]|uniref:DUF7793 family protein n=1 Tax=Crocinitomix algicola TaxID=1740263 RepID=UPI00087317A3|nr:hypothetical protein [Crocinitomix algicola]